MQATKKQPFDFSGYATKSGVKCSDGRTIMPNAFKDMDGATVPLVWQHDHQDIDNVIGHAVLENRPDGVYTYATLNNSPAAQQARELVSHGDVNAFSIFANQLTQSPRGEVEHGTIREVSLVLSGANPGALIDNVSLEHSDGAVEELPDQAIIYFDEGLDLRHGELVDENEVEEDNTKPQFDGDNSYLTHDDTSTSSATTASASAPAQSQSKSGSNQSGSDEPTIQDVLDTFNDQQMQLLQAVIGSILSGDSDSDSGDDAEVAHAGDDPDDSDSSDDGSDMDPQAVYDSLNEQQKNVFDYIVAQVQQEADAKKGAPAPADQQGSKSSGSDDSAEGDNPMVQVQHNAFDSESMTGNGMTDSARNQFWHDALKDKSEGSFKKSWMAHAADYGITNIEDLFPDPKSISDGGPTQIKRDNYWVDDFVSGLKVTPFARIKSTWADLTEEEARAKGYMKGHKKINEVISVGKRSTDPQTIYKKQKLDRDDILDITEFDVVQYLQDEMKMMLQEEVARAVLIGDGRDPSSDDKISPEHIRPVYTDDELYSVHVLRTVDAKGVSTASDETEGDTLVEAVIRAMDNYLGKGTPNLYAAPSTISTLLLQKDKTGRRLYDNLNDLASAMGVNKIVKVPVMNGVTRTDDGKTKKLEAIVVNPSDYHVGRNPGGEATMFNDFDIDYNQQKYLIETRMSGALTDPKTALVIEGVEAPKA